MSDLSLRERTAYAEHLYEAITSDHKCMTSFVWDRIQDDAASLDIETIRAYLQGNEIEVEEE